MVTENTSDDEVVEETPKKAKKAKSKYTHTQADTTPELLRAFSIRIKEDDGEGYRKWQEYEVAANGEKEALRLIEHDGYAPYTMVEGIYKE